MFTAWIKNEYGELVKTIDDCMNISVLAEHEMELHFPNELEAIGIHSNYITIVDSQGKRYFYPLFIYSVDIG